ncbi:MAG: hypothetical protein COV59_04400 [Candidatus Magasanikbacteria bacterium CG11_big_fil_rev_8_21_14_0_20_39_34]|uniref:Methyltransferase domain-containing protein n=1 Tax=Candidatus Magasanikbacteria bacterium CG11_big_fil_rev_8_21_14_0_20_39_34 TaxID=1974653 RepID=A0A2H0N4Q8_9BACT|nr:MAG: hypothetical protein COV59_04400 [Candidatus Magasanikbacteria bacterium CG11_big_fil_rev_8_21_14_0_20_39_34]
MPQKEVWEREYKNPKLVTKFSEPQPFIRKFAKYIRKEKSWNFQDLQVLDLGSGVGRNSNYFAHKGARVVGIEISATAVHVAKLRAHEQGLEVKYVCGNFGGELPYEDKNFQIVLDVTSSNSLTDAERKVYLQEVCRVLDTEGIFFVRGLLKDGDKNVKKLLEQYPGSEKDTYKMPKMGLEERVFTRKDFEDLYGVFFKIIKFEKNSSYSVFDGVPYKRNFFIAYLEKK